jgi:type IV pilus assembly protein PilO
MNLPSAVTTERFSERTRSLLTLVNVHYAGVALLGVLNLFLLTQMYVAWRAQSTQGADALAQQRQLMTTAEQQARPLEGLDAKLTTSTTEADHFYERRLPYAHSQFLTELGALTKRAGVKLVGVKYAEEQALGGGDVGGALTEVRMDANLSGDYRGLVQFINALERDRMFFVIRGVTLSGQQSGTVGLRLGLTTFLRPAGPGETADRAPVLPVVSEAAEDAVAGGLAR